MYRAYKYLSALTVPVAAWISFTSEGWLTFLPLLYVFGLIPLLELFIAPQTANLSKAEEDLAKDDPTYDWMLYLIVPVQWILLIVFLNSITEPGLSALTLTGRITGMGILCGIFGINVAHELGHRKHLYERNLAKSLLLTSLYMHFYIEHNRGHHRWVSTERDPATSRRGETVYFFWLRSVAGSYISAWKLEHERLQRNNVPFFSFYNQMLLFQLLQAGLLVAIGLMFGGMVLLFFIAAATMGFLLLETVNYIEHYGLLRQKTASQHYERVMPHHSWNSDHLLGRLLLFELSRHSDHHYNASRKYQVLRHHEQSPQMPTGYPGMMLLSLIPPLWFWILHKSPYLKDTVNREQETA
jgi:alkane 1-monooxygenase